MKKSNYLWLGGFFLLFLIHGPTRAQRIQHDAEHYVLLHQYQDQWDAEDKENLKTLEEIRKKNNGKRPNIVFILLDDMGFGEYLSLIHI